MFFNPLMFMTGTVSTGIVESIMTILTAIGGWFVSMIQQMLPIFYDPSTGITVIGVLCVCGLGVGVILLVINKVSDFFHWRG